MNFRTIILWAARILGGLSICFTLFMLFAHAFEIHEASNRSMNQEEMLMFVFFPILSLVGLILAYWKELIDGIVNVSAMMTFFILSPNAIGEPIFLIAYLMSGVLYTLYGILKTSNPQMD